MAKPELPEVAQGRAGIHGDLLAVLEELQPDNESCFVKTMTASNVRRFDAEGNIIHRCCQLTLPTFFIKAQQTKGIPKCVVFQIGTVNNISWNLRLSRYNSRGPFEFTFTGGWIQFVTDNGIVKGDILVFSKLTANMSKFQVYVFDYQGLPNTRQRSHLMQASRTQVKVSKQVQNNTKSTKAKIMGGSPSKTRHDADVKEEEELVMPCTGILVPPSFQKKLSIRTGNKLMEIPANFLRKYGSRLQARVQVHGTLKGCAVRDVGLHEVMEKGRRRVYLNDGWRDFVRENKLQVGRDVRFVLTADSYFEVREVVDS